MFDFDALYEAHTVEEAIALRLAHPMARIIAGGSDQLVMLRDGKLQTREFISIYGIDELRGVTMDEEGTIRIGALTSFSELSAHPLIQKYIPVLGEAADQVGGPQIRNIGTIGGNVCNGVTSADTASTLLAWNAGMCLRGEAHETYVPMSIWYTGPGRVRIERDEILTEILVTREDYEGYAGHYMKYAMRNAMDIAAIGCSVNVRLSAEKKTVEDLRIAFGVGGPVPMRAKTAEQTGIGRPVSEETVKAVAGAVLEDIDPRTSWRASSDFRRYMAKEMTIRCFREAVKRSGGEM